MDASLSRDDRAGSCAWFCLRRDLRLAGNGRRHSARKQTPLVVDRVSVGQIAETGAIVRAADEVPVKAAVGLAECRR
jgi:hypothetical protein